LLKTNLQEENNIMKKIVKEKTKQLYEKISEIKNLLQQQSDFISVTAHEFRTPLSIALFKTEETLDNHEGNKEVSADVKEIESALENLKDLTETLFEVQKYDLDKVVIQREDTNINEFFQGIYNAYIPFMKKKNIQFSYKNSVIAHKNFSIDTIHIRQVLNNLLNNAFKHAPQDGVILLVISLNKANIEVSIQDSGKGVTTELRESLFDKFRTEKKEQAGIGLGLYICKKIIELHKGKIWIENSALGGADFRFQL